MTGTETIKLVSLDGTPHWRMPDGSFRPANPETGTAVVSPGCPATEETGFS